jgi:hypothetical protein
MSSTTSGATWRATNWPWTATPTPRTARARAWVCLTPTPVSPPCWLPVGNLSPSRRLHVTLNEFTNSLLLLRLAPPPADTDALVDVEESAQGDRGCGI